MTTTHNAAREYELNKYLQLLPSVGTDIPSYTQNQAPFTYALPESSILRDVLTAHLDVAIARLAVVGAFVVLTDGNTLYFLAGNRSSGSSSDARGDSSAADWLGTSETDQQAWSWLLNQTIFTEGLSAPQKKRLFAVSSLRDHEHCSRLTSVTGEPHLSFYAGTPLTSKHGVDIGVVFAVADSSRTAVPETETDFLKATATKAMNQLEGSLDRMRQDRWATMNEQLNLFVFSRSARSQILEEPPTLKSGSDENPSPTEEVEEEESLSPENRRTPMIPPGAVSPGQCTDIGDETKRLLKTAVDRDRHIGEEGSALQARSLTAQVDKDDRRSEDKGETTYRKLFRRAAECLRQALEADGVLFSDGLIGFHGAVQPVAQPEQELEREMVQRPLRKPLSRQGSTDDPDLGKGQNDPPESAQQQQEASRQAEGPVTRVYTSPDYQRGVHLKRPTEILGMALADSNSLPRTEQLFQSTKGLLGVDEGILQKLMDRHPNGCVWYFPDDRGNAYMVKDTFLEIEDAPIGAKQLREVIPKVRQLIFHPLTDPVSLKRLAGCFAWSARKLPVLTDTVDLASLRGFLHIVESEVSRVDASAAVKQQEGFVSSVSHELRTPLHGILGATQLLEDTDLNSFQSGLLDTIKSCSDTLHETLSSVLAYAKVNQFERRQNKYRQRNPPDTEWALPNKQGISGPDTNFKGLYTCVNIAMLCEETAGVLVAGQLYTKSSRRQNEVTVVLNIDFQDSWNYHTEPGAFRRIATNIIGNALKYTKKGLVTITLTGADFNQDNSKQDNDQDRDRIVTLTVKDTGKGMSKDFVDNHLFVPFAQEDSVASHGVGLGMSIVKSLVSLLGGEIDVRSEMGKGTEIRVKLPMRLSDAGPDQAGSLTREFERNVTHIRDQHLSVSVLGFPNAVRDSLSSYLQEWFGCTIRDSRDEAGSDIVMVEEGNAAASEEAETRALRQGRRQVLLSIAMKQDRLASPMPLVRGYHNSSRIQRPLGPKDMAKGLLSCIAKLRSSPEEKSTAADTQRAQEKREVEPRQRRRSSASKGKQPERDVKKIQMTQLPERKAGGRRSPPPAVKTQDVQPSPAESTPRSPRATGKASSDLLVLVVEDNAINMRLLKAFLTKYGCRDIEEAGNGVVALEKIENSSDGFDVIFMDLSMPVMDGFEATRRIRQIENERRSSGASVKPAVIVALTGLASTQNEDEAFSAGVSLFVTKPVQFAQLKGLLEQVEKREEEQPVGD